MFRVTEDTEAKACFKASLQRDDQLAHLLALATIQLTMSTLFWMDPRTQYFKFIIRFNVRPNGSLLFSVFKFVAMPLHFRACPTPAAQFELVPYLCRTGQQSLWGISLAWLKSMKKSRRVSNGSEPESPLAGVNQELAGTLKCAVSVFYIEAPWLTKILL